MFSCNLQIFFELTIVWPKLFGGYAKINKKLVKVNDRNQCKNITGIITQIMFAIRLPSGKVVNFILG